MEQNQISEETMKYIKFEIPGWLHSSFKSKVALDGKTIQGKLVELMQGYIGNTEQTEQKG